MHFSLDSDNDSGCDDDDDSDSDEWLVVIKERPAS